MIEFNISIITALVIGLFSLFFAMKIFSEFIKSKQVSRLYKTLFFLLFGLAWTCIGLSVYSYEKISLELGEILVKTAFIMLVLNPLTLILLVIKIFNPKYLRVWLYSSFIISLISIFVIINYPISYIDSEFYFHEFQTYATLFSSIVNIFSATLFILFATQSKNKILSKKSYLFGLGVFLITIGSVMAALITEFYISIAVRILLVLFGIIIFYIGAVLKPKPL